MKEHRRDNRRCFLLPRGFKRLAQSQSYMLYAPFSPSLPVSLIAIRRQTRPTDSDTSARWRRNEQRSCESLAINMYASTLLPAFSKFACTDRNTSATSESSGGFLRQCQEDEKPKSPDICEQPSCRRWCGCRHVHRSSPKGAFAHAQRKASPPK